MAQKKIPMRRCVGCNTSKAKKELIRVVKNANGEISLDPIGKMPGRGAYLCVDPACLTKARKKKALERGFEGQIPEEIYEMLTEQLSAAAALAEAENAKE